MAGSKADAASRARLERMRELLADEREPRLKRTSSEYGKSLRKAVPRDVFSFWQPPLGRSNGADLVFEQDLACEPWLVEIRHARMAANPFAFYRGAAVVMAQDLQSLPTTGVEVQAVGDAHIANFGLFRSPDGHSVFDVRDFEETTRAPWEWDVARLAASVEICGRASGLSERQRDEAVLACVESYRTRMRELGEMGNLCVWYAHADLGALPAKLVGGPAKRGRGKRRGTGGPGATLRFAELEDGTLRIASAPPEIVPLGELAQVSGRDAGEDIERDRAISLILRNYRSTLPPECARLFESYRGCDVAHKLVGVGGVWTRAWIVVFEGADERDPLVLQVKEARESVLERYVGKAAQPNHGQRVVEGQRSMQAVRDVFLGWTSLPDGDGETRDYYVRQLWDAVCPIDLDAISAKALRGFAKAAADALACVHARTGDRFAIASYLGRSDRFDYALVSFAHTYADQNERDYQDFCERV